MRRVLFWQQMLRRKAKLFKILIDYINYIQDGQRLKWVALAEEVIQNTPKASV